MQGDADHVKKHGVLQVHALRHLDDDGIVGIAHQHVLGIAAVGAADAVCAGEAVQAQVGESALALGAHFRAGLGGTAQHPVAHLEIALDVRADGIDGADVFMAKDNGRSRRSAGAVVKGLHISAADAAVVDLDHHLTGTGDGNRAFLDGHLLLSGKDRAFHRGELLSLIG